MVAHTRCGGSLREFAKLLGLREEHAEEALRSERVARAVLSRRQFFAAAGALAAGVAFSEGGLSPVRGRVHQRFYSFALR